MYEAYSFVKSSFYLLFFSIGPPPYGSNSKKVDHSKLRFSRTVEKRRNKNGLRSQASSLNLEKRRAAFYFSFLLSFRCCCVCLCLLRSVEKKKVITKSKSLLEMQSLYRSTQSKQTTKHTSKKQKKKKQREREVD